MNPDDLIDSTEVAAILGLSTFRAVSTYRRRYPDFPAPLVSKGNCILWDRTEVERWQSARKG